jgi:Zn-dependent peptidase ImmA (M78 family)/transcriptional regulator with XRE-family HTH domain
LNHANLFDVKTTEILKQALEAAKLSLEDLAAWSRIDEQVLHEVIAGQTRLNAKQLDRVACVFGLRFEDFLRGDAVSAPMTLFLRSASEQNLDIRSVLTTEVDLALGEFQRVVRDISDVETALGISPPTLPSIPDRLNASQIHLGDHQAQRVREYLNLGLSPIPSMKSLVESLGIRIVWVSQDQVDRLVEGACIGDPRPVILVNLIEEGKKPWHVRTTLAHELCHLLFDMKQKNRQVLVSRDERRLPQWYAAMEQNARAFAACLLAPTEGVKHVVSGGHFEPTSELAIRAIGEYFGIGRTVAINRLQDTFRLTDEERADMERRKFLGQAKPYQADFSADAPPEEIGLRGEPLRSLLVAAVGSEKLLPDDARKMLGIGMQEPLPFKHLPELLTAPTMSMDHWIMRMVAVYLAHVRSEWSWVPGNPTKNGDVWEVPVLEGAKGFVVCGKIIIDRNGQVVKDETPVGRAS